MELDDMKAAWVRHGARLERSIALSEQILREVQLRKVRLALAPYAVGRAIQVVLGIAALLALGSLLHAHLAEPRYFLGGGALFVLAAVLTALSTHVLVRGVQLDYDGPVAAIQREVERLQLLEYRAFKWALLGGIITWLPAALLSFELVTGIDALARVDAGWLLGNLLFGLVVLVLGQALSRRWVGRPDLSPRARRIVEAVSGRALSSAARRLAELERFIGEESSEHA